MAAPKTPALVRRIVLFIGLITALALISGCGGGGGNDTTTTATAPTATAPATGGGGGSATGGGGSAAVTPGTYVGQLQGSDDSIALVTDGHRLSGAYLCIPQSTSQWIRPSPFTNGKAPLVARRGVTLGSATFTGNSASATVSAGGQRTVTAKPATGDAGLYRKASGTANQPGFSETGWIVLPDGSVCGSTNSITSSGGFQSQQAPSQPASGTKVTNFANPFPF